MWIACLAAVAGTSAQAHPLREHPRPGDVAKRPRAFFELDAAYWVGSLVLPRSGEPLRLESQTPGVIGWPRIPLAAGLAYAPSEMLVVGARVAMAIEPHHRDGLLHVTFRGDVTPFAEILFSRDREVRPFALIRGGFGTAQTFVRPAGERGLQATGGAVMYPTLGIGMGTHVFLDDHVSLDAAVTLDHRWNYRRPPVTAAEDGLVVDTRPSGWILRDSALTASLVIGFSHWF